MIDSGGVNSHYFNGNNNKLNSLAFKNEVAALRCRIATHIRSNPEGDLPLPNPKCWQITTKGIDLAVTKMAVNEINTFGYLRASIPSFNNCILIGINNFQADYPEFYRSENIFKLIGLPLPTTTDDTEKQPPPPPKRVFTKQDISITNYLTKMGLIGIPKNLDVIFAPFIASDGPLADEIKRRGLQKKKGIILYGPPGTGKTSFARHLGEFLNCDPKHVKIVKGTELLDSLVGQTEKNIDALFEPAVKAWQLWREQSPLHILCIDEIDAITAARSEHNNAWENTMVNQLLSNMDGYVSHDNMLVIGCTNNLSAIDKALLRTGRFGTQIKIDLPEEKNRADILTFYLGPLQSKGFVDETVDTKIIADMTAHFSGADLKGLVGKVNRASLTRSAHAYHNNPEQQNSLKKITLKDFEEQIKTFNK